MVSMNNSRTNKRVAKVDINRIAQLANIELTEEEKIVITKHILEILDYVSNLSSVNTGNVEPLTIASDFGQPLREDKVLPSLSQEEALANCKKNYNGFFEVDAIFEEV